MSRWGQLASEAEQVRESRWANLYVLSFKRAEMFVELLEEKARLCRTQAELIKALERKLFEARRENAELSEALEEVEAQLEEFEVGPLAKPA